MLSSLVVCFFARGLYDRETCGGCLSAVGQARSWDGMMTLGEDILRCKHAFKAGEGFDSDNLEIPARVLEVRTPRGALSQASVLAAIAEVKQLLEGGERLSLRLGHVGFTFRHGPLVSTWHSGVRIQTGGRSIIMCLP